MCWWLSKKEEPIKPSGYVLYIMPWSTLAKELKNLGLEWIHKEKYKPDMNVGYTDLKGWQEIAPFLVSPADRYIEDRADCDKYAKMASAKAALDFGLNSCFECWGDMDLGFHAFNLIVVGPPDDRIYLLMEPNAGFEYAGQLFAFGQYNYKPKAWK